MKKLSRIMFLFLTCAMLALTACDGGGSSSGGGTGSGTTGTVDADGLGLPAAGSTGTISLTNGDNKYGFKKIWKSWDASNNDLCVSYIFASIETHYDNDKAVLYFGDNNLYVFMLSEDSSIWYLIASHSYTYESGVITATGTNPIWDEVLPIEGRINFTGTRFRLLTKDDERYDIAIFEELAALSGNVTVVDDNIISTVFNDDEEDETPVNTPPTLNSISASYSGTSVTINYNITAPAGETINSVTVDLVSPTLYEKYALNEEYLVRWNFPVYGQLLNGISLDVSSGATVSGNKVISLPTGAENGTWHIAKINVMTNVRPYELTKEKSGNWEPTYYYGEFDSDSKYADTGVATASFTVSGSTEDIEAPELTGVSVSGTNITITASSDATEARIIYVSKGDYIDNGASENWGFGSVSGSTATFDLSSSGDGTYYIAMIALKDAAGNSSVYFGYDPTVSFWNVDYGFGLDFSVFNRYWANEKLPDETTVNIAEFTKS